MILIVFVAGCTGSSDDSITQNEDKEVIEQETEIKEEVMEMTRKKTYGHYSVAEFQNQIKKKSGDKQEP